MISIEISRILYYLHKVSISHIYRKKYFKLIDSNKDTLNSSSDLLQITIINALENIPFYQELNLKYEFSATPLENLKRFPTVSRYHLQNKTNKFISSNISPAKTFNTSGSSGDPLYFYRSALSSSVDDAHQQKSLARMGLKKKERVVLFCGFEPSENDKQRNKYWNRNSLFGEGSFGSVKYSANALNLDTVKHYHKHISEIKPAIIKGYPSAIYSFFRLCSINNLEIDWPIKAVHLTSENILDYQVDFIKSIINCEVHMQYGHTECAMFAENYGNKDIYYFSPLYGFVEILNSEGEHVGVGEVGEVTVTSFHNYKQPFIRYRTADYAIYNGIENNKITISKLVGRSQDFLIDYKSNEIPITSLVSGSHFMINAHLEKWQIVQKKRGEVEILLGLGCKVPTSCKTEIINKFLPYSKVTFRDDVDFITGASGKHKFFVRLM